MTTQESLPRDARPDSVVVSQARTVDFAGLPILFDERVIEPRAWTARQSLWAADLLRTLPEGRVLELCAGAGHIGLRAVLGSDRELVSVEADPVAATYAAANALAAGLGEDVEVREGRMADALGTGEQFVLVIADPPYLPTAETGRYPEDPVLAVDGGDDGLAVVRQCLALVDTHLAPCGVALLQLRDRSQAAAVAAMLPPGLADVEVEECEGRGVLVRIDRVA